MCWAVFIAILRRMGPAGLGLDTSGLYNTSDTRQTHTYMHRICAPQRLNLQMIKAVAIVTWRMCQGTLKGGGDPFGW